MSAIGSLKEKIVKMMNDNTALQKQVDEHSAIKKELQNEKQELQIQVDKLNDEIKNLKK